MTLAARAIRTIDEVSIPVRYRGREQAEPAELRIAVLAAIRGEVHLVDKHGKKIPETQVVICPNGLNDHVRRRLHAGSPVSVVNLGGKHAVYVLLWSTAELPTVTKERCRPVGQCENIGEHCNSCCNDRRKRK